MLNYDGKFAFSQWPPAAFIEIATNRGQNDAIRPVTVYTDTSARFTVMYADESRNISFTSQQVKIIGNGYADFDWTIDTENTGAISFYINGHPLLSFSEANGAVFTVTTGLIARDFIVSTIDVARATTPQEGQFLQAVDDILKREIVSTTSALELAHILKQLLISSPFSIYAINEKRNIRISYNPFDFRLSLNNKHHAFHWWNITKEDAPSYTKPNKDKEAFLACPVIILDGIHLSVEDVLIASCYIRNHSQGSGSTLTAKQQLCLKLHNDNNSNSLSPVLSQLDNIAEVMVRGIEPLVAAVIR